VFEGVDDILINDYFIITFSSIELATTFLIDDISALS
jgi:hypothetical protein